MRRPTERPNFTCQTAYVNRIRENYYCGTIEPACWPVTQNFAKQA